jgi:hypothetical protein
MSGMSRHGTHLADDDRSEGILRPDQLEDQTTERFSPLVAWSIVLLASIALWGVLGLAVSSLVSALV